MKTVVEVNECKRITVKLTREEVIERAEALAKALNQIDLAEAHLADVRREVRAEIKDLKAQVHRMKLAVHSGREDREEQVVIRKDWINKTITTIWNGEVIAERPMRGDELQTELIVPMYSTSASLEKRPVGNDISEVINLESRRKSKRSSVD